MVSWQTATPLNLHRYKLSAVSYNGYIYALGGISTPNGTPLDTIEATKVY